MDKICRYGFSLSVILNIIINKGVDVMWKGGNFVTVIPNSIE